MTGHPSWLWLPDEAAEFPLVVNSLHGDFFQPFDPSDVDAHSDLVGRNLLPVHYAQAGDLGDIGLVFGGQFGFRFSRPSLFRARLLLGREAVDISSRIA